MHRDLIKPQHQSGGDLFLAASTFAMGILFTTFGFLACWEIYTVFRTGKAIDLDFICGLLLTPCLFAIGVPCLLSSPGKLISWFGGRSWRNDMIARWGEELTQLESSVKSLDGNVRLCRTRYGGGVRSSPSFEYTVEICNLDGHGQFAQAKIVCLAAIGVDESKAQGPLMRLGKWYDGHTKAELIRVFDKYKTDELEDSERRRFTRPIRAQIQTDNLRNPHMLIIQTEESRFWCLAGAATNIEFSIDEFHRAKLALHPMEGNWDDLVQ